LTLLGPTTRRQPAWSSSSLDGSNIHTAAQAVDVTEVAVVVGTHSRSSPRDSTAATRLCPGQQDRLVRAVAATGALTASWSTRAHRWLLPWQRDVAATLLPYSDRHEMGNSLADILLGTVEPGGRLPTTWPDTIDDVVSNHMAGWSGIRR